MHSFYFLLLLWLLPLGSRAWASRSLTARRTARTKLCSSESGKDTAEELRRQAEKLRREVDSFEQSKREAVEEEERAREKERDASEAQRERYSAIVPILKPDGTTVEERCDFPPRHRDGGSYITSCLCDLPLGVILGESEEFAGCTVVDEVAEGGNGEAAGLVAGDLVRAITACRMTMETPTWQILAGGIGRPKTARYMYSADGRPFEEIMEAVLSNRQDPEQRPMVLVVERREERKAVD